MLFGTAFISFLCVIELLLGFPVFSYYRVKDIHSLNGLDVMVYAWGCVDGEFREWSQ